MIMDKTTQINPQQKNSQLSDEKGKISKNFDNSTISDLLTEKDAKNNRISLKVKLLIGTGVIGILGILGLSLILPSFLSGCGGGSYARESEGKNGVGMLNRSQHAYHFENNKFSSSFKELDLTFEPRHYNLNVESNSNIAYAVAIPKNPQKDNTRAYSGAILVDEEGINFKYIMCRGNEVTTKIISLKPILTENTLICPDNMTEIN